MIDRTVIRLLVEDQSVLSALRFSLSIEGFDIAEGNAAEIDPLVTAALVIDERYCGDGLTALEALRKQRCHAPAIILATNPTARLRARITPMDAELIEKPLLGDELSRAIRAAFEIRKAA